MVKDSKPHTAPPPFFIITIDTEGDDLWSRPSEITFKNISYLPRFQELCNKFNFKPVYLSNNEVVNSQEFKEFGLDLIKANSGEVGMHLHAWNSSPLFRITDNESYFQPFLFEYPLHIIREKINIITSDLEEIFNKKIISHRAGRWCIDSDYISVLIERGFNVDCSVTPFVSWKKTLGNPKAVGGQDYSKFPSKSYFMNVDNLEKDGDSNFLQVPMTIVPQRDLKVKSKFKIFNPLRSSLIWLRPNGENLNELLAIVDWAILNKREYIEFTLHSSELMPGGSPIFENEKSIEKLYDDLEILFLYIAKSGFTGLTLEEFYLYRLSSRK